MVKYHLGFVKHCVNSTGYREKGFKKWACGIVIKVGCLYCNGYLVPKGCEGPDTILRAVSQSSLSHNSESLLGKGLPFAKAAGRKLELRPPKPTGDNF